MTRSLRRWKRAWTGSGCDAAWSITLAYYGGYSYRQVGELLKVSLGAIKTRIRDGLIRMRDCLGVS
jgi:Sigma-70, region 4